MNVQKHHWQAASEVVRAARNGIPELDGIAGEWQASGCISWIVNRNRCLQLDAWQSGGTRRSGIDCELNSPGLPGGADLTVATLACFFADQSLISAGIV